jgi:hypothetical protein
MSKNVKVKNCKVQNNYFTSSFLWVWNFVSHINPFTTITMLLTHLYCSCMFSLTPSDWWVSAGTLSLWCQNYMPRIMYGRPELT